MLRKLSSSRGLTPLAMHSRSASGSEPPPTYITEVMEKEYRFKRIRDYHKKMKAEKEHVASLPGIRSDEYKPSLEQGSINLRAMKIPYYSPQLRAQPRGETEQAFQKIAEWTEKIHGTQDRDEKFRLVGDMFREFKVVMVDNGDPLREMKWHASDDMLQCFRRHGIVRGITGVMHFDVRDDEELVEMCVEHSGNTWMPQAWAGGRFLGCWRTVVDLGNSGEIVDRLEEAGLTSKLKGCYYDIEFPNLINH